MKPLPFFLLFFWAINSLFAQTDFLQILEKQGDSLFLVGRNDQANRVYFRALQSIIRFSDSHILLANSSLPHFFAKNCKQGS